jgi:hypothetical protein
MSESAARVAVIVAVTLTVVFETAAVALTFGAGSLGQPLGGDEVGGAVDGVATRPAARRRGLDPAPGGHVGGNLALPPAHRRVLAVLSYLNSDTSP